jgi:hypothetical protein
MVKKHIMGSQPNAGLDELMQHFFKLAPPPPSDDVTAVLLKWE